MRVCPVDDCGKKIPPHMFSCRQHWFSLPKPARDLIWAAWRQYQADLIPIEKLREIQNMAIAGCGAAT